MDEEKYQGLIGKTRVGTTIFTCSCGTRFGTKIYLSLNTSERPDLGQKAMEGKLHAVTCPTCRNESEVPTQFIYHDPDKGQFLLVLPEHQRHMEIGARAQLLKEIAETPSEVIPDYVINFSCVFGEEGLRHYLVEAPQAGRPSQQEIEEIKKFEAEVKDMHSRLGQQEVLLSQKEAALVQREKSVQEKEQSLAQMELSLGSRESKIRERGEKITEMEDLLQEKSEELEQRTQELDVFAAQLKQWEAKLKGREDEFKDFARALEEKTKRTRIMEAGEAQTPRPKKLKDTRPDAPTWQSGVEPRPSPSLSSSIEDVLPGEKKAMEIRETDVIEEADLIDEVDIIDEKPIVPIPLKESPREKRAPRSEARVPDLDDRTAAELMSEKARSFCLKKDQVLLWARTEDDRLLVDVNPSWARIRCHMMHDGGGFPWIVLRLAIRPPKQATARFFWLLNFKEPENYRIVKYLEKKFQVDVYLVSGDLERYQSFSLQSNLTGNLKRIIEEVEKTVRDNKTLQPERGLDEQGFIDRLMAESRKPFPFHSKYFQESASPKATLEAMEELARWSTPEMLGRIILIHSFPVESLNDLKTRVLKTALGHGIFIPDILWKDAPSLGLVSSKRDMLQSQIRLFARLCEETSDLTREQKQQNWQNLLEEARKISLPVDIDDASMALNFVDESYFEAAIIEKMKKTLDVDMEKADRGMLSRLLKIKGKRADAVLEVLYRGEKELFGEVARSVMDMEASELNKALPVVTETEDLGETVLLEGLEAGRREVKIACAAHLGRQKLRSAIIPLVKMMLEVPDPDWKLVAWLIAGYGISAIRTLEQFVKDPRGHEDRIIYLLAAFVASGQQNQVEEFSTDSNLLVRSMIKKSLETASDIVKDEDAIGKTLAEEMGLELP